MKKAPLIIFFLLAFLLVNAITKGDYLNPYRVTMFLFFVVFAWIIDTKQL